jgi:predicted aminopeptidase
VSLYTRWVPVLERLLAGVEGDLEEFYRLMERLRGRSSEERRAILSWFEAQTAQASD